MDDNQKQIIEDYQTAFATPAGKRVLADLQYRLNYRARIVPMGAPDATAFELGKREAYLYILDKIEADPEAKLQTVAEGIDNASG